jgi:OOP family OmpA-OmpF porin
MKTLLWITTVLFFLLSWWWYVCPHKKVCPFGEYDSRIATTEPIRTPADDIRSETPSTPATNIGPLTFAWSSDEPITNEAFKDYRDSIASELNDNDIIEVMGGYFADEENKTSFSDLGMARASKIRFLFADLPDDRFQLKSAQFERDAGSERERPFLASLFRKIISNESIREVAGRMVINFPHASDEMLDNIKLNTYLDDLIARLNSTNEKVHLVGHTDSTAGSQRNMALGLNRANAIKNLMVRKGLSSNRIIVESQGETAPIASNETSEGRRANRRVELTIIP